MTTELKNFLLSGGKTPTHPEGTNLELALRRHAREKAKCKAKQRLSLNLEDLLKSNAGNLPARSPVKPCPAPGNYSAPRYRGATSDLSSTLSRSRKLSERSPTTPKDGPLYTPTSNRRRDSLTLGSPIITEEGLRSSRTRMRKREDEYPNREDSMDVSQTRDPCPTASLQMKKLANATPMNYAEAQALKKKLKKAVSGPNTTFEDLKLYRTAMKRLRKIAHEEQEKEIKSLTGELGATRYGAGASLGSSYLSSIGRNRSSTRDGSGSDYGGRSGYSSGTGSRLYDVPGRQSGVYKGVNSLASKFGGTVTEPKTSVPDTQTSSRLSVDRKAPVEDSKLARPSTLNISPAYQSIYPKRTGAEPSTKLDTNSSANSRPKSYTRNETAGNVSGNVSDALSGHGSDYLSGYNSGSRYNPSSYRRSNSHLNATSPTYGRQSYGRDSDSYKSVYSRQNSGVFDSGDSSSWRSKVYGNNNAKTEKPNNESTVFNDAIQKLTKSGKEDTIGGKKLPDGVSPNAIKVLPILSPGDLKLKKNKAPADFTSASEDSDDERNSKLSPTSKSRNGKPTVTVSSPANPPPPPTRAFRHLSAVSALPSLSTSSHNSGLTQLPKLKLSSKYATQNTESVTSMPATTSKWLNKDTNSSNTSNDHSKASNNGTAGNKDCRKSVLNMNLEPENKESMRKQQEEKREELRRLRKRNTENDTSANRNSLYDNIDAGNHNNIAEDKTDKNESVSARLSPLSPFIQKKWIKI